MVKLYETESYLKENQTTVTYSETIRDEAGRGENCNSETGNGEYGDGAGNEYGLIRLDESIFFPEEGGQYADTGYIEIIESAGTNNSNRIRLLDGQIENGIVTYKVAHPIPAGTKVACHLDWDMRFMRMQNHSGEHVLTGAVHNKYGLNNCGFHLSDDDLVTLDFDGILSYEQIIEMEREANRVIYENVPIRDSYPTREELGSISYRSKIEIEGQVRLVTIGDENKTYDVCACCAPHVRRTGEIGIIKVISVVKFKKGIQVAILCGERALDYINKEHSLVTKVARDFSTAAENIPYVIKNHMDEIADLKARLSAAIVGRLIRELDSMTDRAEKCVFTEDELSANDMKNVYNEMVERFDGFVGVFCGSDEAGYRFNAGGKDLDARHLLALMQEGLLAKGGGSPQMIQGRVGAGMEAIRDFYARVNS